MTSLVAILTGRACGPSKASFAASTAILRQLWRALIRLFEVINDDGSSMPLQKFVYGTTNAGATITCGIASNEGLSRRVILDDLPSMSAAIATLIKFATSSSNRLATTVPGYRWWRSKWEPSGLVTTFEQLRQLAVKTESPSRTCAWTIAAGAKEGPLRLKEG